MPEVLDLIGVESCGCATAWCSGDSTKAHLQEFRKKMADTGREVEELSTEIATRVVGPCHHKETTE